MTRDRMAFMGLMLARLGFAVALLLGLAMWAGLTANVGLMSVHQAAGLLVSFGILLATARFAVLGQDGLGSLYAGSALAIFGVLQAVEMIRFGPQVLHFPVLLAAIGFAEMGAARIARVQQVR